MRQRKSIAPPSPSDQESEPGATLHPALNAGSVDGVCPSYTLVYPNVAGGKSVAACAQNPAMKQL